MQLFSSRHDTGSFFRKSFDGLAAFGRAAKRGLVVLGALGVLGFSTLGCPDTPMNSYPADTVSYGKKPNESDAHTPNDSVSTKDISHTNCPASAFDCDAGAGNDTPHPPDSKHREDAGAETDTQTEECVPDPIVGTTFTWSFNGDSSTANLSGFLNGDKIDRVIGDRGMNPLSATGYAGTPDTSDSANPFTDGKGGFLSADASTQLFKVTASEFEPLQDLAIFDNTAGKTYAQNGFLWLSGSAFFSDAEGEVVASLNQIVYSIELNGSNNSLGIPVCTTPTNSTFFADCYFSGNSPDYLTSTHRVKIRFLGEDWIISGMNPALSGFANGQLVAGDETGLVAGGEIKLAKESVSGIFKPGESISLGGGLTLLVEDILQESDGPKAIVSLIDSCGTVYKKDKLTVGSTKEITTDGKIYKLHAYKIAPGYTFGAKWVDLAVFSTEITLRSGQSLNIDNGDLENKPWKVLLAWKNIGGSETDTQPDALRRILVYTTNTQELLASALKAGDSILLPQKPKTWSLTYNGMEAAEYDDLVFTLETEAPKVLGMVMVQSNNLLSCTIQVPYVFVTSSTTSAFTVPGASLSKSDNFYVATGGGTCTQTDGSEIAIDPGSIIVQYSSDQNKYALSSFGSGPQIILYPLAGDSNYNGIIILEKGSTPQTAFKFSVFESAGVGISEQKTDVLGLGLHLGSSPNTSTFDYDDSPFNPNGGIFKKGQITSTFAGPLTTGTSTHEIGFVSERGSVFDHKDSQKVKFRIAKSVVPVTFTVDQGEE